MAGTVTITETTYGDVKKIKFCWTSSADTGAADGTTTYYYTGKIEGLTTVPATGDDAPSDNYGVTIKDSDDVDVLMGAGATRDQTNTEHVLSTSLGCVVASKLTIGVTSAGNSNKGTSYLFIR